MMKKALKSIKHFWHAEWKPWLLECLRMKFFLADVNHRRCSLLRAGILGAGLACIAYCLTSISGLCNDILQSSITILALGLPTFYVLWKFRTHDVQRQIDKVQEQIAKTEENTNNSTFFECARILTEEKSAEGKSTQHDSLSKKTALEQLAYIRKTGFDEKRIDSLTKGLNLRDKIFYLARFNGLDLSIANLYGAKLIGANLRGAELNRANLTRAKLIGADLTGANLTNAELTGADLTGAKLNDADLANAELNGADLTKADLRGADLTEAILIGAIYNDETEFSGTGFEKKEMRDKAGMIYRPDESA